MATHVGPQENGDVEFRPLSSTTNGWRYALVFKDATILYLNLEETRFLQRQLNDLLGVTLRLEYEKIEEIS